MNNKSLPRLSQPSIFTAFAFENRIALMNLVREWYLLTPVQRYLHNMAASHSRFVAALAEERTYTIEDWNQMCFLLYTAGGNPALAAKTAYEWWGDRWEVFPITHVERLPNGEETLLLGDDPCDAADFVDLYSPAGNVLPFPSPHAGPHRGAG